MQSIYAKNESTYPITLTELKAHLRYDGTDSDTDFTALIKQASGLLERETDRTLTETTYDLSLDGFRRRIWLPSPPLYSVTHVKYYTGGTLTTLDPSDYYVMIPTMTQGFVELAGCWPQTDCRPNAVQIRYVAGKWSNDATPQVVKRVLLQYCGYLDSDREAQQKDFAALQRAIDSIRHEGYAC